jgi:phosphatidylethanolamine/phosphatidyl-N-methylethanolamine N-methyltransferase
MEPISTPLAITTTRPDPNITEMVRRRYQRIAPYYDLIENLSERRFKPWRDRLWSLVRGSTVLEAGVGTGKNMAYYPANVAMTAVDLTPGMLERARERAEMLGLNSRVEFRLGDVQALDLADRTFDAAIATFVFCSVPDPILGLRELKRVVKSGGSILLLEHMRSPNPMIGAVMDFLNPAIVRMMGANINRRTVENVRKAGLGIERIEDLGMGGIIKLIVARA